MADSEPPEEREEVPADPGVEAPDPAAETPPEAPDPAAETPAETPDPTPETSAETPAPAAEQPAETPEPAAETPAPAAATPAPAAEADDPAAEAPGPAADDAPAQELTDALEAAIEEIPDADAGPGAGTIPEPPPEAEQRAAPSGSEEAVPGAHLEPDLVLEESREGGPASTYDDGDSGAAPQAADEPASAEQPGPIAATPMDLAADARYHATGKRKSSVARVILRPGSGSYTVNGRSLAAFFPRPTLQKRVQQPLETAGYESRMDVVARIHGGGVSSQAGALRHGVARALVAVDPNLRQELKRRGFLTRDARVKERKKAGLKKARKRPQFSKR